MVVTVKVKVLELENDLLSCFSVVVNFNILKCMR